jgi:TATA-box binding protein (TBP) (component of TFIID and TFIIIB)
MSMVNLDCQLDLKQITLQACNAEYNPKVKSLSLYLHDLCLSQIGLLMLYLHFL